MLYPGTLGKIRVTTFWSQVASEPHCTSLIMTRLWVWYWMPKWMVLFFVHLKFWWWSLAAWILFHYHTGQSSHLSSNPLTWTHQSRLRQTSLLPFTTHFTISCCPHIAISGHQTHPQFESKRVSHTYSICSQPFQNLHKENTF